MDSEIKKLLEKYWNGETNLKEEKTIKSHFKSNPRLSYESRFFCYLTNQKSVQYKKHKSVTKKPILNSIAATVLIGIITAVATLVFNDAEKDPFSIDNPEKALKATKEVLMMISTELKEGQSHTFKLTKINKGKKELEKD